MVVPLNVLGVVVGLCKRPQVHGSRLVLIVYPLDQLDDALHVLEVNHHTLWPIRKSCHSVLRRAVSPCGIENILPHIDVELREQYRAYDDHHTWLLF